MNSTSSSRVPRPSIRFAVAVMGIALLLGSCARFPDPVEQGKTQPTLAERPQEGDTVRGVGDPAVVTLPLGSRLQERPVTEGDPLPANIKIGRTNLNGVPVTAALQAVLANTNISLTWQEDDFDDRAVTILNISGSLDKVVNRICAAGRIYCGYRNGTLEVTEKQTFIIEMPPVTGDAQNSIADSIATLAGDKGVKVDKDGGNIIYTTDTQGQQRVQQYLTQLRRGRPLIVMQLYIWEVRLDDSAKAGIRWDSTQLNTFGVGGTKIRPVTNSGGGLGGVTNDAIEATSAAVAAGGVNFGATFSGAVNAAAVLSFLQSNGSVETVSNPQMTFVSGTKSEFSIGGKQNYISGVGQLVGSTVSTGGTSNTTGIGQNTVQTDQIDTGIKVEVAGAYEGGVIFGGLTMQDVTLLGFDVVPSGGTQIQLPRTQERKLSTIIRLRPGDTLLLAGLRSTSDDKSLSGLPTGLFGILPFQSSKAVQNREMVIMLRPAIIRFTDQPGTDRVEPVMAPEESNANSPQAGADKPTPASADTKVPDAPVQPDLSAKATAIDEDGKISTDNLQRAFGDVSTGPNTLTASPVGSTSTTARGRR